MISSTTNIVRVTYDSHTNDNFKDRYNNFRIEWIVDGCGGVLNQLEGEFTSPEYPGYFALNTTCEWNIITDYGRTIEITIQDLWSESSRNCSFDSLAVRIYAVCFNNIMFKILYYFRFTVDMMSLVRNC